MKKYVLPILLLLFVLILFFLSFKRYFWCYRLSCILIKNFNDFKLNDIYQEKNNTFRAIYKKNKDILRVEIQSRMNSYDANQYMNAGIARMKGLFNDAPAPYPGVVSDTITCNKEYQPLFNKMVTKDQLEITYFIGYLSNELVFGSCTKDQVSFKGILAYFYCSKHQQVFQLEMIAPIAEFNSSLSFYRDMLQSIECK